MEMLPCGRTDGRTNKQTSENRATQSMDSVRLSFAMIEIVFFREAGKYWPNPNQLLQKPKHLITTRVPIVSQNMYFFLAKMNATLQIIHCIDEMAYKWRKMRTISSASKMITFNVKHMQLYIALCLNLILMDWPGIALYWHHQLYWVGIIISQGHISKVSKRSWMYRGRDP